MTVKLHDSIGFPYHPRACFWYIIDGVDKALPFIGKDDFIAGTYSVVTEVGIYLRAMNNVQRIISNGLNLVFRQFGQNLIHSMLVATPTRTNVKNVSCVKKIVLGYMYILYAYTLWEFEYVV